MSLILIGGGSRSGKSLYALTLARNCGSRIAFVATARAEDDEMRDRIQRHQEQRGSEFATFEEPFEVASLLIAEGGRYDTFVVDCVTLWLSNHLLAGADDIPQQCRRLIEAAVLVDARVLLVTNEVGCGIVPENALARRFRDLAGSLNQDAATAAVEVHWMVFGIPLNTLSHPESA
jgi:adenosylcobinamide kinase/adenosylcobinamide-phosphate guanylyltransferase